MGSRIGSLLVVFGVSLLPCLSHAQTYSKTETIEYSDNLASWVLGQVKRTTTDGVEDARTDYDPTTALPVAIYSFGELQQSATYNLDGTVATLKDGNGNITTFGSYKLGIPLLIQFPATPDQPTGTSVTVAVDDLGQIRSVVDAAGAKTCYDYDAMGRMQRIQYPSETTVGQCGGSWADTLMSFESGYPAAYGLPAGLWRQRVTTGNLMTETLFDAFWRPVVKQTYDATNVNATISQTVIRYDANGNVVFESYPQSTVDTAVTNTWADPAQTPRALGTSTLYDALNRVTSVTRDAEAEVGPLKTTTHYLSGFETEVTDPNQKVTTTAYMTFDEPTTDWPVRIDAPEGISQIIVRDAYGKTLSITQSGLYSGTETDSVTKTLVYDIYQRLCRTTEPETGDSSIWYDGANNVRFTASGLALTESGCARDQVPTTAGITYTHDAMNRLLTIQPAAGTQSTIYHYTPTGNINQTVSGNSTWSAHYNYRGMLTDETLALTGQDPWTIGYAYDVYGNLAQLTYPDDESVAYAPDARGRPTQVGSYASQIGYFPNGQVSGFVYGNGTGYVAAQNARLLLSNFSYGHDTTLNLSEELGYDENGNILTVKDLVSDQRNKTFQYDGLNRLTSAVAPALWGTEQYTYDPLNNLRTRLTAGQTNVYNYGPTTNLLASITRGGSTIGSFGYDNQGNETSRNGVTLQFDQKNQLLQIPGVDSYQYDAAGSRTIKTSVADGASTYTFYNHAGQLLYQYAAGTATATDYIYLGSKLVARNAGHVMPVMPVLTVPAISSTGSYTVSWGSVSAATSYTLQEQVNAGAWATIQSSSATSSAISGKGNGSYGYRAQACNVSGCGPWSTVVSTTVLFPPPTPASITIPAASSGTVAVSWAASATATSYTLQHADYGVTGWSTVYSGSTTSYTQHETVTGAWIYQVQACNAGGCSAFRVSSGGTTVTIPPASAPSLSVPASNSNGSYSVSWGSVSGATSYTLQEQVNGGGFATVYAGASMNWSTSGRVAGTYGYRVQACNAGGCSGWSSTKTATVSIPIAANGQSYTGYDAIAPGKSGSAIVGFEILSGTTWEAFTSAYNNGVGGRQFSQATGSIPASAVTVKYTWTFVGYPAGMADAGGTVSNPASASVNVGTNPVTTYTTAYWPQTSPDRGRTYQLRVDFYNATGANISSSAVTMIAETTGSP